jgi:hypothetical protein
MQDTPEEILQKQREIFFNKTASERSIIGAELINFGRIVVESSIKQQNPDISPIDLKVAVFKRYYQNCFDKVELERIIHYLITHFKKDENYTGKSNADRS